VLADCFLVAELAAEELDCAVVGHSVDPGNAGGGGVVEQDLFGVFVAV
jgi:hypothetical protein